MCVCVCAGPWVQSQRRISHPGGAKKAHARVVRTRRRSAGRVSITFRTHPPSLPQAGRASGCTAALCISGEGVRKVLAALPPGAKSPGTRVRNRLKLPPLPRALGQGGGARFAPAGRAPITFRTLPQGAQLPCACEGGEHAKAGSGWCPRDACENGPTAPRRPRPRAVINARGCRNWLADKRCFKNAYRLS